MVPSNRSARFIGQSLPSSRQSAHQSGRRRNCIARDLDGGMTFELPPTTKQLINDVTPLSGPVRQMGGGAHRAIWRLRRGSGLVLRARCPSWPSAPAPVQALVGDVAPCHAPAPKAERTPSSTEPKRSGSQKELIGSVTAARTCWGSPRPGARHRRRRWIERRTAASPCGRQKTGTIKRRPGVTRRVVERRLRGYRGCRAASRCAGIETFEITSSWASP